MLFYFLYGKQFEYVLIIIIWRNNGNYIQNWKARKNNSRQREKKAVRDTNIRKKNPVRTQTEGKMEKVFIWVGGVCLNKQLNWVHL